MKLKEYLSEHSYTQITFAQKLGVSRQTLSRILKEERCSENLALKIKKVTCGQVETSQWMKKGKLELLQEEVKVLRDQGEANKRKEKQRMDFLLGKVADLKKRMDLLEKEGRAEVSLKTPKTLSSSSSPLETLLSKKSSEGKNQESLYDLLKPKKKPPAQR